jgi:UDP-N-acetylglucosamine 1-carboxyvinyltransferase
MTKLLISPTLGLHGNIAISGSKNAALPIICAALLTAEPLVLSNVPALKDVTTLLQVLAGMGVEISRTATHCTLQAKTIHSTIASYNLVKTMRAAILTLGSCLARCGTATISLPGGCAIGARPIEQHLKALIAMGATVNIENGYIHATTTKLHGAHIVFDMVTVTGTANILMAAVLADGVTILENAAREPEIIDLAQCLIAMGANIAGAGSDILHIVGVSKLHGASFTVMPDRIEAGTFAVAAAMTRSNLTLTNVNPRHLGAVLDKLAHAGSIIVTSVDTINITMQDRATAVDIKTAPYPGFPTDMQAQFMALNATADGSSIITETIFENRYMHVPELCRMGAHIVIDGHSAIVQGVAQLTGAEVMATDLRASASLVLAGLVATNTTTIDRIYHLDRGYDSLESKLNNVGANIKRITN